MSASFGLSSMVCMLVAMSLTQAVSGAPCGTHSTCSTCIDEVGCGWCTQIDACIEGDFFNAAQSTLCSLQQGTWFPFYCPSSICVNYLHCKDCVSAAVSLRCGWCGASRRCEYGNSRQSLVTASSCNLPTADVSTKVAASWLRNGTSSASAGGGSPGGVVVVLATESEVEQACHALVDEPPDEQELRYLWALLGLPLVIAVPILVLRKYKKWRKRKKADRVEAVGDDVLRATTDCRDAQDDNTLDGGPAGYGGAVRGGYIDGKFAHHQSPTVRAFSRDEARKNSYPRSSSQDASYNDLTITTSSCAPPQPGAFGDRHEEHGSPLRPPSWRSQHPGATLASSQKRGSVVDLAIGAVPSPQTSGGNYQP